MPGVFGKIRGVDVVIALFLASVAGIASFAADIFFSPLFSYITSLFVIIALLGLTVHAVEKTGFAALFYAVIGIFTYNSNNFGVIGIEKLASLLIAGILFELTFAALKRSGKSVGLSIIISSAISAASIPAGIALQLSTAIAFGQISMIANLAIFSSLIGLAAAMISSLIWFQLRTTKFLLRLIV